jgi:hypothetical protein
MADKFLTRIQGRTELIDPVTTSTGASDAGRIPALGVTGQLDESMMPSGISAPTVTGSATESIAAGRFVNLFSNGGSLGVRLADNSNGRVANGFVKSAVVSGASAVVYSMGVLNSNLTGLTPGVTYFLGTAGGVLATPLDSSLVGNNNKVCQEIGIAVSATEMMTSSNSYVIL